MKKIILLIVCSFFAMSAFASASVGEACLSCVGIVTSPSHDIAHKSLHRTATHTHTVSRHR